jgi:EpsI family protein
MNGLRAVTLVFNPHSEIVAIHNLQGIAILLGGLLVLYGLDGLLSRVLGNGKAAPVVGSQMPRAAVDERPRNRLRNATVTAVLIASAAVSLWAPTWQPPPPAPIGLMREIGENMGGWRSERLEIDYNFLGKVAFSEAIFRRYRKRGQSVDLFIGLGDRDGRLGSPFSPKTALPGSGWIVEERGAVQIEPGGLEVESRLVRSRASRRLVFHWYAGTDGLASESVRSLLALDASPLRRPGEGVVVRMSTEVAGPGAAERREAEERLRRFYLPLSQQLLSLEGWLERKTFS